MPEINEEFTRQEVARSDSSVFDVLTYRGGTFRNLQTLPIPTDDLTKELGIEVYDLMMNDTQVASSVRTAVYQILSRNIAVLPSHPDTSDPKHKKSVEIADFIKRVIEHVGARDTMEEGIRKTYIDSISDVLMSRFKYGNGVAEITYKIPETGSLKGMAVIDSLSSLDPITYKFVVDKHNNVPYLLVWTGDKPPSVQMKKSNNMGSLVDWGWKLVNSSKFFHTVNGQQFGDPRGTSLLRSAYGPWYLLQNIWPEYHKYLVQFASGIIKGTTAENAVPRPDAKGNIVSPLSKMEDALSALSNGSWIALEYGNEVDIMRPEGNGDAFRMAVDLLNNQIVKSILNSILATNTSRNQSRSASSVHKDISDLGPVVVKESLCEAQRYQLWRPLVHLNFGPEIAEEFTPYASMGRITAEDRATIVSSYAAAGFQVTPTQMQFMASELEMPIASEEEMKNLAEKMKNESQPKGGMNEGNNRTRQEIRNDQKRQEG